MMFMIYMLVEMSLITDIDVYNEYRYFNTGLGMMLLQV